jgi:hypothetical protein
MREQDFISLRIKQADRAKQQLDRAIRGYRKFGNSVEAYYLSLNRSTKPIRITRIFLIGMRKLVISLEEVIVGGELPF